VGCDAAGKVEGADDVGMEVEIEHMGKIVGCDVVRKSKTWAHGGMRNGRKS
jgi:hypothetical protein